MPRRPESLRPLPPGDFRAIRSYLAEEVFLQPPGGGKAPTDPMDEESWDSIMDLPTDVLLRTTDYQGRVLADCHDQWGSWIEATPNEPEASFFMFDPMLDASDEFHAAPFIAAHGWYRQATAGLRNALETIAVGASFAVHNDAQGFTAWRKGNDRKFGNAVDLLSQDATLSAIDRKLGGAGLFGLRPDGVVREIHGNLSRYVHGRSGHTNVDIWQSNGPVWVWEGFTQFWVDYCDTMALCYVLGKIGWPPFKLRRCARELFGATSERWHNIASAAVEEFFPKGTAAGRAPQTKRSSG